MLLEPGRLEFTRADLVALADQLSDLWTATDDADWSARAGTLDWSCRETADHAIDCVYAAAFFLASRRESGYPTVGLNLTLGARADVERLTQSLRIAARLVSGVVADAEPDVRAVIFRRPTIVLGRPVDFAPRAALELILHGHDVCTGLGVDFDPDAELCARLREHTRDWPAWRGPWAELDESSDPWRDLLVASGRPAPAFWRHIRPGSGRM